MQWNSVHVFYYDQDQSGLLLDAVRPLFEQTAGLVESAYWLPHWRQGPHLRLNFRTDGDTFATRIRPMITDLVGGYLEAEPSTRQLDPAVLRPLHERLAEVEVDAGPLSPWFADNSIQEVEHESRAEVLGSAEAVELLDRFYADTTALSFDLVEHVRSGRGSRLGLAFDLLIATAHALSKGGVTRSFISFRSHAEAFCNVTADGRRLRPIWDSLYARQATTLSERVRDVVATLDQGGSGVPFVREWIEVLAPINLRGAELIAAGSLPMQLPGRIEGPAGEPTLAELSPFHRDLESHQEWWSSVQAAPWFAEYRLVLNYTYLHLTRLGVQPVQRFLLCHLAANAVEEAYGVSAAQVVGA